MLPHSPLTTLRSQVSFCASVAAISSASAWLTLSWGSMVNAMLVENHISHTAVDRIRGRPWPPHSCGSDSPIQPASAKRA